MTEMIFVAGSVGEPEVTKAGVVSVPVSVTTAPKVPYSHSNTDLRYFTQAAPAADTSKWVTKNFVIDFHYSGEGPTIDNFEDCEGLKNAVTKEHYIDLACSAMKVAQYHIWPAGAGYSWALNLGMQLVTAKVRAEMQQA